MKKIGLIIFSYKYFLQRSLFWWHRLSHLPFSHQDTACMTKFYEFHFHNNSCHPLRLHCALEDQDKISWLSASMLEPIQATLKHGSQGLLTKMLMWIWWPLLSVSLSLSFPPPNPLKGVHSQKAGCGTCSPPASDLHRHHLVWIPWLYSTFQHITCGSAMQWIC